MAEGDGQCQAARDHRGSTRAPDGAGAAPSPFPSPPRLCTYDQPGPEVTKDGFISYNGNQYLVPDQLNHAQVEVQATLEEVKLSQDARVLAVHLILEDRGQRRLAPEHRRHQAEPERRETSLIPEMVQVQRRSLDVYELVLR